MVRLVWAGQFKRQVSCKTKPFLPLWPLY